MRSDEDPNELMILVDHSGSILRVKYFGMDGSEMLVGLAKMETPNSRIGVYRQHVVVQSIELI